MIETRSLRFGAAAAVVLALVVALVATVPSFTRAQPASAQAVCEGGHFGYTCSTTASVSGVYCGGMFYSGELSCPSIAGESCMTALYPNQEVCTTTAGVTCGGVFYSYQTFCPTTAGLTCNGVFYAGETVCPITAGITCNGSYYANTTVCPITAGVSCNGAFYANTSACPISFTATCPNGAYPLANGDCPSVYVSGATPATTYVNPVTASIAGYPVTFNGGWDIVSGPTGTVITGNIGPMYAFRPGDTTYEVVPQGTPLTSGMGYWAYFPSTATGAIAYSSGGTMSVSLPPGQFVMIGNPGDSPATVSGADVLLVFNTATNNYAQTNQLAPGQGAWALSWSGAQAAITNLPGFTSVP